MLVRYLPTKWADAAYNDDFRYEENDLYCVSMEGLSDAELQDLRSRELASYAHQVIWEPALTDMLLACVTTDQRYTLGIASDAHAVRMGIRDTLVAMAKSAFETGLLENIKKLDALVGGGFVRTFPG